jgi:hypothetical protein
MIVVTPLRIVKIIFATGVFTARCGTVAACRFLAFDSRIVAQTQNCKLKVCRVDYNFVTWPIVPVQDCGHRGDRMPNRNATAKTLSPQNPSCQGQDLTQ